MFLTKDQLLLPRKDGFGNPTSEPDWHTLPTPDGGEAQIFGYMGQDEESYWHYILGFFTKGTGLELGAFYGYSSILVGLGMRHSPWHGKLISIDWFGAGPVQYLKGDNTLERFNENLRKFGVEDYVTGVQGSCEDPNVIPFTELDWVFFDASHCLKELRINMEIFGPMVKPGGFYMWHDVSHPEVREHIEECRAAQNLVPMVTGWRDYECWMKPLGEPKDGLESLRNLIRTQGEHGTWNCDAYMMGLFNGLELALATLENRSPEFREKPETGWLSDTPLTKPILVCDKSDSSQDGDLNSKIES